MWTTGKPAGRLLTIRFTGTLSLEEADAAIAVIRGQFHAIRERVIFCGDLRGLRVLAPDVSKKFVGLFHNDNPRVERSAMLLDEDGATLTLQLERMVREGGSPARRTFRLMQQQLTWLAEILTPAENTVAEAFLRER